MLRWISFRRIISNSQYSVSSVSPSAAKDVKLTSVNDENVQEEPITDQSGIELKHKKVYKEDPIQDRKLVAAAFASLRDLSFKPKSSPISVQLSEATDVNSLLAVAEAPFITRHQALQVVSKLADWASMGQIKLSEFESDIRFAKLCRLLGKHRGSNPSTDLADLSVVLNITADEQAAKLVSSISLQQSIKILESLSSQKRRSTSLLRSLAFNIGKSSDILNLKEAADIFYACTVLNYPDEVLLEKVTADIFVNLPSNNKPAVMGSIIKSIGIVKYRNKELLDNICDWILGNQDVCRAREYFTFLITLASVNYVPNEFEQFYKLLKPFLKEEETKNSAEWVDVVWSLVVLQQFHIDHLSSVLSPAFLAKLTAKKNGGFATNLKLLNINGVAQQLGKNYIGNDLVKNSPSFRITVTKTKEKKHFMDVVLATLSNLVEIKNHVKLNVNTEMGCIIDAECRLNSEGKILKLNDQSCNNTVKVALMLCDYHDMCRGLHSELNGLTVLTHRLIRNSGYHVLSIPHTEFNLKDKLITRVEYIQNKLQSVVSAT